MNCLFIYRLASNIFLHSHAECKTTFKVSSGLHPRTVITLIVFVYADMISPNRL